MGAFLFGDETRNLSRQSSFKKSPCRAEKINNSSNSFIINSVQTLHHIISRNIEQKLHIIGRNVDQKLHTIGRNEIYWLLTIDYWRVPVSARWDSVSGKLSVSGKSTPRQVAEASDWQLENQAQVGGLSHSRHMGRAFRLPSIGEIRGRVFL